MKTALQMLSDEHQKILKVIDALLKECSSLESGSVLNKDFFMKTIDFIRNYADRFHHAKEENILFHEFNQYAKKGKAHCNPVTQMLSEHEEGRKYVKGMEEGVKDNDKQKIIGNARNYAQLLQDHICKEDNILYPMVDEALDKKVKQKMLTEFEQVNTKMKKEINKHLTFYKKL